MAVSTWRGPLVHSDEIGTPTAADLRSAIARLDGAVCTELSLSSDEPFAYFTVSGGPELYLVSGETAAGDLLQLTEPAAADAAIALVCGGQLAHFARRDLVRREAAFGVLARFLAHGDHDASLPWDVQ